MDIPLTPEDEAISPTTTAERLWELAQQSIELAYLVAQNPHTPSKILEKLANKHGNFWLKQWFNEKIMQAIAANPNTPKDILLKLGADFPQEFLNNPIFELLILENSDFYTEIPIDTLSRLLSLKPTPKFIFESAIQDQRIEVKKIIANHADTSKKVLETLSKDKNVVVRREILYRSDISVDLLKIFAQDKDDWIRRLVASKPNIPAEILNILANDFDEVILIKVASHPNTSIATLNNLAQDFRLDIRWAVASNPNTPKYLRQKLLGWQER